MLTSSHSVKKKKKKKRHKNGVWGWGEWEGVVDDPPLPEHAR